MTQLPKLGGGVTNPETVGVERALATVLMWKTCTRVQSLIVADNRVSGVEQFRVSPSLPPDPCLLSMTQPGVR